MKKRFLPIMLSLTVIFSSYMSITAFAESINSQDGIVATLSVDKESYDLDEEIDVNLTVENTNSYDTQNVTTEIILPSGVSVTSGTTLQESVTLLAGESVTNEITVIKENSYTDDTPSTGDDSITYIWAIIAVVSLAGLIFISIKNKKLKNINFLVLVLALAIFYTNSPMTASANTTDNVTTKTFTVSETVLIDGEENLIEAKITYDYTETDEEDTVTVSFNTGNGDEVAPITLETGSALTYYPSTTLDGYTFELWYTDPSFTTMFDYTSAINKDTTLYAKFTEIGTDELVVYDATEIYLDDQTPFFVFTVYSEDKITSSNMDSYVSMENTLGATPTYNISSNGNYYTITAEDGYTAGSLYTATLATGVTLVSPEVYGYNLEAITKLSFRIYKEEVVDYELNKDIVTINISDLLYFDEENYTATLPKDLVNESTFGVDTVIYLEDGEDSFYVKVTYSDTTIDGLIYITFIDAELEDIYDYVDIYFENMEMEVTAITPEDEIADMIKSSEGVEQITLLLATAILESETANALGDGTAMVDVTEDVDLSEIMEMLTNSSNTSEISTIATDSTNTSISGNMFSDNAEISAYEAFTLAVELMEDLEVSVTLGTADNENFNVDDTVSDGGLATDWVGANIMLSYQTDLGNNVKLSIEVDISQYINVSVDGYVTGDWWDALNNNIDFDYAANVYTQTDLGFTILVCSANNETEEEPDPNQEPSEEELWGEAWTDITDEISGIVEDDDSDSDTLVAKMMTMLEEEGDYITLIDEPIFMFSVNAYVVDINIEADFVVKAAFAAGISADFSYLSAQEYGIYTKNINDVKYVCYYNNSLDGDGRYVFELSVCGYLGVRAGVALEVGISLPALKSFGNVGLGVEVGAYADLYAYARYIIAKTETDADVYQSLDGSVYFEMGIYLDIYLFAESEMFDAQADWVFYSHTWPLFSAGNKYVYLGLSAEVNSEIVENNTIILTGDFTSKEDAYPTFYGNYLDITTGDIEAKALPTFYTTEKGTSTPYIDESVYWYDYATNDYEYGIIFKDHTSSTYTRNGVTYSDHEIDYDYFSSIYGDYEVYKDGDTYIMGTMDVYINYSEGSNFLTSSDSYVGTMDFIWISDDYDGSLEGLGNAYTATFEIEVEDGENIVLAEKTVYSGKTVGSFDPYEYASDELKQEYALMSYSPSVSWAEELVTYTNYEWNIDPATYVVTDSDITFTLSVPKRNTQVAYVYYDEATTSWAYGVQTVENGDSPTFDTSDGEYITLDTLYVYDRNTSSTQIISDPDNLSAVYTENDIKWSPYCYMIYEAEDYTKTGYATQSDAFSACKTAAIGFADDYSYSYSYYYDIYVADYEFDTYTVTYITDTDTITEEVQCYSAPTMPGVFDSWIYYLSFEGWDADEDGDIDFAMNELPITNADATYKGVYSSDYVYTVAVTGSDETFTEYKQNFTDDIDEDVYTYFENNPVAQGVSEDGSIYSEDYWLFTFAGDITTIDYNNYEDIKDRLEQIQETYYYWNDSYFEFEYVEVSYYNMTIDPANGSFDEETVYSTIEELLETDIYGIYANCTYNDDGTITLYVKEGWTQAANMFILALEMPTVSAEDEMYYTYEFSHWEDQYANEYANYDTFPVSDEALIFTAVYQEKEITYYAKAQEITNNNYLESVTDEFTGTYDDYLAFIEKYTTDYSTETILTDTTVTDYTKFEEYDDGETYDYLIQHYWDSYERTYEVIYVDDETGAGESVLNKAYQTEITLPSLADVAETDFTYRFVGWDIDGNGTADYEGTETYTVESEVTFTAVWEKVCTIAFKDASGDVYASYTELIGTGFDISEVELPTANENYQFSNWQEEPTEFTVNMFISADYEYVDKNVTVNLTIDGELTTYNLTVKYYDTIESIADALEELVDIDTLSSGKTWSGWYVALSDSSGYWDNMTDYRIKDDDTVISGEINSVYVTYITGTTQYSKTATDIGDIVTVADTETGYGNWSVSGVTVENGEFEMPSNDVIFTALADLDGTFTISDGTNANVYDAVSYDESPTNTTISGYDFDTTNGILWINSNGLTLSSEVSDIVIIVDDSVTSLTLQDLTIQNSTKKTYTIPDFEWQENAEGIESDPINDFVIYAYGDEFNLTIDGDVEISQTNETDGRQYIIYYMNLQVGTYDKIDYDTGESEETTGLIADAGTFTMTGINDATFTASSLNAENIIMINGDAEISDISFALTSNSYGNGIKVMEVYNTDCSTILSEGILEMQNCTISGSVYEYASMTSSSNDSIFTDCTFNVTSGGVDTATGNEQTMSFIGATSGSIADITAQGLSLSLSTGCELVIGSICCYDREINLVNTGIDPSSYYFEDSMPYMYDEYDNKLTVIIFTGN